MTTKFEEELENAAIIEGNSASRYEESKNGTKFPYYYGVEVGFKRGAHFAQSFYLPLLREAMEALEKVCAPESDGFGDFIADEFMLPDVLEGRVILASLRQKLGEGEEK